MRSSLPTEKPRILIIDNEKRLCEALTLLLAQNGYETSYASDSRDGVLKFSKYRYDVVLLDVIMPKMDGPTCLVKLREVSTRAKIIVMTGHPIIETAVEMMKNGAFDYIKKPFESQRLLSLIQRAVFELGLGEPRDINRIVGANIKNFRQQKKMTIKDITKKTGLSPSLISQIENGKSAASLSTLSKIGLALGIELAVLVASEATPRNHSLE